MKIVFSQKAIEDYGYFKDQHPKIAEKIKQLLANIIESPKAGLGKPEPLKYDLSGYWSRRIDREHRLVYKITTDTLYIISCRYHY